MSAPAIAKFFESTDHTTRVKNKHKKRGAGNESESDSIEAKAMTEDYIKILIDVVMHPEKYHWIINVPGRFDAAKYLYENKFESLNKKVKNKINEVIGK